MKIFIIYHKLYDYNGQELTIGGIQTYLLNLVQMLKNNGYSPVIYQLANKPWNIEHEGVEVHGVQKLPTKNGLKQSKHILNEILKYSNSNDLLIWGTDSISIKTNTINSLSIQHGIGFDYIANRSKILKWIRILKLQGVYKFLQRQKSIHSFMRAKHKVCVDYNYLNWMRTMLPREELDNIHVIPNFTHINNRASVNQTTSDDIQILFARRFSEERGVLILIDIVDELLERYENVFFTIAGSGPYEAILHEKYEQNNKVTITKYKHSESLEVHSRHHIAIIPTYGSEGTSLSLLEAMTSGCVPIASNVGGMTNIILDGFNGFLVNPNAESFIAKLSFLIGNKNMRMKISRRAKESADNTFSYSLWEEKWLSVINNAIK